MPLHIHIQIQIVQITLNYQTDHIALNDLDMKRIFKWNKSWNVNVFNLN